jgi:tetratricopeptide (TPR) repeat protein
VPNVTIQLPHNANNATNNVLQGMKVIKNPNHDTHVHNSNTPPASSTFVQRNLNNLPKNNTPLGTVLPQGSNVRILPTQPRVVVPTKTPPIANFPIYRTNKPVPPLPPPQQTPPRHDHDDHDHHHHHYPTQNNYVWYPYGYGGYNSGYGGYYGNYGSYYPNYNSSYYNSPYYGYGYSRFGVSLSIGGSPSYSYVPRTSYYGSTSYGSYGSSYDSSTTYSSPAYTSPTYSTGASRLIVSPATDTTLEPADRAGRTSHDFAADGEREFKAGNYQTAVRNWRHALVDEPNNGAYLLLLSQGLFATGDFEEAAGVTQHAARSVSPEHWNVVVKNYKELYGSIQDYTNQLRALEKARSEKPDSPALRFLLGWHYGFLGYPQDAITQLDKLLELVPEDEIGKTLREQFAAQLPKSELPPAPVEGRKI